MSRDVPAVYPSSTQIDVCDKRPVFAFGDIKQLDGTLARRSYDGFESSVAEAFLDDGLNIRVVFNDQVAVGLSFGDSARAAIAAAEVHAVGRSLFRRKCAKVYINKDGLTALMAPGRLTGLRLPAIETLPDSRDISRLFAFFHGPSQGQCRTGRKPAIPNHDDCDLSIQAPALKLSHRGCRTGVWTAET